MEEILAIIACTVGAGACIPLGGMVASVENIRPRWLEDEFRHFVIAFGGGILYLVFQDIAPQAHMERHWGPPLGAVAGFCLGMLGAVLTPVT